MWNKQLLRVAGCFAALLGFLLPSVSNGSSKMFAFETTDARPVFKSSPAPVMHLAKFKFKVKPKFKPKVKPKLKPKLKPKPAISGPTNFRHRGGASVQRVAPTKPRSAPRQAVAPRTSTPGVRANQTAAPGRWADIPKGTPPRTRANIIRARARIDSAPNPKSVYGPLPKLKPRWRKARIAARTVIGVGTVGGIAVGVAYAIEPEDVKAFFTETIPETANNAGESIKDASEEAIKFFKDD